MMNCVSYLDHNASHPLRSGVADAVAEALMLSGNASSVHGCGRKQHALIEDARDAVLRLVMGQHCRVIFTSGATEANNLAIGNSLFQRVLVSAIEHPSVLAVRADAEIIPVSVDGNVDLEALDHMLGAGPRSKSGVALKSGKTVVSVMMANNETGAIQPVKKIADIVHRHGCVFHCDAVQAVGRIEFSMQDMDIDLLSLSGHKFGAPQGIGALIVRDDLDLKPLLKGGGQERGLRAGTENVPAIAGLLAAISKIDVHGDAKRTAALRDHLEYLVDDASEELRVFSKDVERLPNTSCFAVRGLSADTQVMALDLDGIAISAGSACSSGKVVASPVISAMGFGSDWSESAIRVSFGPDNTEQDVDRFIKSWVPLVKRHQQAEISFAGTAA